MYNTIYTKLIIDYGVTYYGAWHLANVTGHQWSVLPSEIQVLSPLKKKNIKKQVDAHYLEFKCALFGNSSSRLLGL